MCKICSGEYKGETFLDCCPSVKTIPDITGTYALYCIDCPLLTSIPVIPGLQKLFCHNCPLLTTIAEIPGLQLLWCRDCPLLTTIPDEVRVRISHCPFLHNSRNYERNMQALLTLQRFCRKNLKYWRIKNWVGTVECTEWFYDPRNMGGQKQIQKMGKFLSGLTPSSTTQNDS
jgi:hypothetical protein